MLDPWIIEEILKREKVDRDQPGDQPELEIPLQDVEWDDQVVHEEDEVERGVIIVDFSCGDG